jgi:hypothetical protein
MFCREVASPQTYIPRTGASVATLARGAARRGDERIAG